MKPAYVPERAMAIVAHPDDIEFTCAGTLARWAKYGAKVAYVICTSGEVGITKSGMTKEKAAEIREAEQRKAAEIVGAEEVTFLRQPDGLLQPTLELRKMLVREIRRFRPEVVITGDPTIVLASEEYINHPDHRAAAQAALDAVAPASAMPLLWPEVGAPHQVRQVYIFGHDKANVWVDVTETIGQKIAALRQHASQMGDWDPTEMIKEWSAETGKEKGLVYAESYLVITLERSGAAD